MHCGLKSGAKIMFAATIAKKGIYYGKSIYVRQLFHLRVVPNLY